MNMQELRGKDDSALEQELIELRREAFNLRMQKGTGQLSRPSQFRTVRRDIARVKTLLNARKRSSTSEI